MQLFGSQMYILILASNLSKKTGFNQTQLTTYNFFLIDLKSVSKNKIVSLCRRKKYITKYFWKMHSCSLEFIQSKSFYWRHTVLYKYFIYSWIEKYLIYFLIILYFRFLLSPKMDADKPFACDICGKSFRQNITLLITEESIQEKNRLNVKYVKRLSVRVLS